MKPAFRWELIAARWALDRIPSEALPQVATDALEAGFDSPSLRRVAGESDVIEARRLFQHALDELGIDVPDRGRAGLVLAKAYAARIVKCSLSPYEGARQIWRIQLAVGGLTRELHPFVYWASEWQEADGPKRRHECDIAIRAAAADLIAT